MKYSLVRADPVALRPPDAAALIGISVDSLDRCRRAAWIKPGLESHGLVLYDIEDVRRLWTRIKKEGLPARPGEKEGAPC